MIDLIHCVNTIINNIIQFFGDSFLIDNVMAVIILHYDCNLIKDRVIYYYRNSLYFSSLKVREESLYKAEHRNTSE